MESNTARPFKEYLDLYSKNKLNITLKLIIPNINMEELVKNLIEYQKDFSSKMQNLIEKQNNLISKQNIILTKFWEKLDGSENNKRTFHYETEFLDEASIVSHDHEEDQEPPAKSRRLSVEDILEDQYPDQYLVEEPTIKMETKETEPEQTATARNDDLYSSELILPTILVSLKTVFSFQ